ncbi:MAG: bifunctional diguanylate cyclase/phosphodiesterase [Mycobacteriales bacterium]
MVSALLGGLIAAHSLIAAAVVVAACVAAVGINVRAGVLVAGIGGGCYTLLRALNARQDRAGLGLSLTVIPLLMLIAWAAGRTADEVRRLDSDANERVQELHHRSLHDPLTGLANREMLLDRLGQAMERAEFNHRQMAVICLDIDNFKLINDSLGHTVGDELLVRVGERLHGQLRDTDAAARFDGNEFVLVCEDLAGNDDARQVVERLISVLRPPFGLAGRAVSITASIGIAVPSSSTRQPHQLIQDAGQAMHRAKLHGGGQSVMFTDTLQSRSMQRLDIESELREAVARRELRLHYQPIIDLVNERICGVEALLRWEHPTRGLLGPAEFLPVAESSSLILGIGAWVLDEACAQAALWGALTTPQLTMAINVSLRQIVSGHFDADLRKALDSSGVDPARIHLEITETTLLEATQSMASQLVDIADLGVSVGLDDFGTGYSSLSLIKAFPVRFLKIDRSFTNGLGTQSHDAAIASAVIGLGRELGLQTIAEGIESPAQLSELSGLGCQYGQGFHLARPQTAGDIEFLLNQPSGWAPAGV